MADTKLAEKTFEERFKDITFERTGTRFVLPKDITWAEAIKWMERKAKEEEVKVAVYEQIDAYVLDGAYAFTKAVARTYGWNALVPTPGFFGDSPPTMIGLEVAPDKTLQIPWGRMVVPSIDGFLDTSFTKKDNHRFIFAISGEVKQKDRHKVAELAALTRQLAKEESVYKGQAIRVRFPAPEAKFNVLDCPKFLDLTKVKEDELLFNDEVIGEIQANVFNAIEKTSIFRKHQIPLKTGVLLHGPWGTGKTMTANHAAAKCIRHGWTFIYLEDVKQLGDAIYFAQQYAPAVIFAEDIDRAVKGQDRTEEIDKILNTLDGVDTKNSEIMVVLTTNHLEDINRALLRPGRLDAVIEVKPPNSKTVEKLIRLYSRGMLDKGADLSRVGQMLEGRIPSSIQKVVENSSKAAVTHLSEGDNLILRAADLELTAGVMLKHLKLLETTPKDNRTDVEKLGSAIGEQLKDGMSMVIEQHKPLLDSRPVPGGTTNGVGVTRVEKTSGA